MTADAVRLHLEYSAWANRRLMKAAAELPEEELTRDFGTSTRNVLGTLVHVYAADRAWLARVEQKTQPASLVAEADMGMPVLENDWPRVEQRLKQWAAGLTDEAARAPLAYTDYRGRCWSQPPWQLVLHIVNHGTHHRGQVSGFLRAMGHTPPKLDLIAFYRELAPHA
ncbi:MAG TPA: DinB family protein [Bryobacteraceae bacterium]